MYQGLLGTFPFTVLEQEVCTFRDLKFSREQVYAEHRVLAGIPCLQHMGRNLDPVSLTVQIVPLTPVSTVGLRLRLLESVAASGDEMALVIGLKYYGLYVLKSYEITHRQLHYGVTLSAEVQLALQEYSRTAAPWSAAPCWSAATPPPMTPKMCPSCWRWPRSSALSPLSSRRPCSTTSAASAPRMRFRPMANAPLL